MRMEVCYMIFGFSVFPSKPSFAWFGRLNGVYKNPMQYKMHICIHIVALWLGWNKWSFYRQLIAASIPSSHTKIILFVYPIARAHNVIFERQTQMVTRTYTEKKSSQNNSKTKNQRISTLVAYRQKDYLCYGMFAMAIWTRLQLRAHRTHTYNRSHAAHTHTCKITSEAKLICFATH